MPSINASVSQYFIHLDLQHIDTNKLKNELFNTLSRNEKKDITRQN